MRYLIDGRVVYLNSRYQDKHWILVEQTWNNCFIAKSDTAKPVYALFQITLPSDSIRIKEDYRKVWGECIVIARDVPGRSFLSLIREYRGKAHGLAQTEPVKAGRLQANQLPAGRELF